MHSDEALTLYFPTHVRVAGEPLHGTVDLNFTQVQEDNIEAVRVKLRGSIRTCIRRGSGENRRTYRETIPLLRDDVVLWTRGSMYPPPGSHILTLPFSFLLPRDLPPSFHAQHGSSSGMISYSVEVVGDRPGLFRFNRRIGSIFPIVPQASPAQVSARAALLGGWQGNWGRVVVRDQIRHWPWGEYGHAEAELQLPDLRTYPIGTPIPFRLRITTRTKPMRGNEHPAPSPSDEKPLFPAPPVDPAELELRLDRLVWIKARGSRMTSDQTTLSALGGLGAPAGTQAHRAVRVDVQEPIWIPEEPVENGEKGKGVWSRTVVLESAFSITCSPTLETPTLTCSYAMHFKVPFPGMFNNLKCDFPVALDSGLDLPPSMEGEAGSSAATPYGQHTSDLPVMMDLPPAYWAGGDHDWDLDEKH